MEINILHIFSIALTTIAFLGLGFFLGWKYHQFVIFKALVEMARQVELKLIYENINNEHFLYKEDETFVCQASTMEELAQKLNEQNNNQVVAKVVDRASVDKCYIIDGKIHNMA